MAQNFFHYDVILSTEQYNTMEGSIEHEEHIQGPPHGEENDNADTTCGVQVEDAQVSSPSLSFHVYGTLILGGGQFIFMWSGLLYWIYSSSCLILNCSFLLDPCYKMHDKNNTMNRLNRFCFLLGVVWFVNWVYNSF